MNVLTAQSVAPRRFRITFTIDSDNNITAFGSAEEAAAATPTSTPFDSFASQKELAELIAGWPAERLVALWNSLPGVEPVKGLQERQDGCQPHLGTHPGARRACPARGGACQAESLQEGQGWRTGGQARAR
jgi:hypothetical protein